MEEDVFDLYDDLDEFDFKVKYEEAQEKIKDLQEQLDSALKKLNGLESEKGELQARMDNLERSFQSLLMTARSEIKRKDAQIVAARKEKDDIVFRRKNWGPTSRHENPNQNFRNQNDDRHFIKDSSDKRNNSNFNDIKSNVHENPFRKSVQKPEFNIASDNKPNLEKIDDTKNSKSSLRQAIETKLSDNEKPKHVDVASESIKDPRLRYAENAKDASKIAPRDTIRSTEQDISGGTNQRDQTENEKQATKSDGGQFENQTVKTRTISECETTRRLQATHKSNKPVDTTIETNTSSKPHFQEPDDTKIDKRGDQNDQQGHDKGNVKMLNTNTEFVDANKLTDEAKPCGISTSVSPGKNDFVEQINKASTTESPDKQKISTIAQHFDEAKDHRTHKVTENQSQPEHEEVKEKKSSGAKDDNTKLEEHREDRKRIDDNKKDSRSRETCKEQTSGEQRRDSEKNRQSDKDTKSSDSYSTSHKNYDSRRNDRDDPRRRDHRDDRVREDSRRRDHRDHYDDRYRSRNHPDSDKYYDRRYHRDKEYEESRDSNKKEKYNRDDKYDRDCNSQGTSRSKSNEDRKYRHHHDERSRDYKRRSSRDDERSAENDRKSNRSNHGESRNDDDRTNSSKNSQRHKESHDSRSRIDSRRQEYAKIGNIRRKSRYEDELPPKSTKREREEETTERASKRTKPNDKEENVNKKRCENNQEIKTDNLDGVDSLSDDYLSAMKRQLELEIYGELSNDKIDDILSDNVERSANIRQHAGDKNQSTSKPNILRSNSPTTAEKIVTYDKQFEDIESSSDEIETEKISHPDESKMNNDKNLPATTNNADEMQELADTFDEISSDGSLMEAVCRNLSSTATGQLNCASNPHSRSDASQNTETIRSADSLNLMGDKREISSTKEHLYGPISVNDKLNSFTAKKNVKDVQPIKNAMYTDMVQQILDLRRDRHQTNIETLAAVYMSPHGRQYSNPNSGGSFAINTSAGNRFELSNTETMAEDDEEISETPVKACKRNVPNNLRNGNLDNHEQQLGPVKKSIRKRLGEESLKESKKQCEADSLRSDTSLAINHDTNSRKQYDNINCVDINAQSETTIKTNSDTIEEMDTYDQLVHEIYSAEICETLLNDIPHEEINQSMHFSTDSIFGDSPGKLIQESFHKEMALEENVSKIKKKSEFPKCSEDYSEQKKLSLHPVKSHKKDVFKPNCSDNTSNACMNMENTKLSITSASSDRVHKNINEPPTKRKSTECSEIKGENSIVVHKNCRKSNSDKPSSEEKDINLKKYREDKTSSGDRNPVQKRVTEKPIQQTSNKSDKQVHGESQCVDMNSKPEQNKKSIKTPTIAQRAKGKVERKQAPKKDSKQSVTTKRSAKSKNIPSLNVTTESFSGTLASARTIQRNADTTIKTNKLGRKPIDASSVSSMKSNEGQTGKVSNKAAGSMQGVKLVGHIIDGFEREASPATSNLDSSRELKNELFKDILGIANSTPYKSAKYDLSKLFDTSSSDSSAELKILKLDETITGTNNNQQGGGSPEIAAANTSDCMALKSVPNDVDSKRVECAEASKSRSDSTPVAQNNSKIQILNVQIFTKGGALNDPLVHSPENSEMLDNNLLDNTESKLKNSQVRVKNKICSDAVAASAPTTAMSEKHHPKTTTETQTRKEVKPKSLEEAPNKDAAKKSSNILPVLSEILTKKDHASPSKSICDTSQPVLDVHQTPIESHEPASPALLPSTAESAIEATLNTSASDNHQLYSESNANDAGNSVLSASQNEKRNISIASTNYLIEKVDSNVVNVFITRRKVKKKKKD